MKWLETLVAFAAANLHGSRELEELWSRGVSDDQIALYQIGYLDQALPPLEGAESFLDWSHRGAKLDDVIVLPLTNALGQVKGVQFRHVERDRKGYMDFFVSRDEPVLFGLAQAMPWMWEHHSVCLVEGAFDLFPLQRLMPGTVATLTSKVTGQFARFLRRNVVEVLMGYDLDTPGKKGIFDFQANYGADFKIRVPECPLIRLPNGKPAKDPSEIWEAMGDEAFGVYMKAAFGNALNR